MHCGSRKFNETNRERVLQEILSVVSVVPHRPIWKYSHRLVQLEEKGEFAGDFATDASSK
jgi:hypothetical protein